MTTQAVFVHGGVSGTAQEETSSLGDAVRAGLTHDPALDAVAAAVGVLENDPALNAGFGATLSRDGTVELDAGIADGSTGRCAGVANVSVKNPIVLARAVLERTSHVLLAGAGASAFARELGLEVLSHTSERQQRRFEDARRSGRLGDEHFGRPETVDTVGAVALDSQGRLAAGSSTGGVFGKLPGRVGDSPIFGAGIFADENVAVVGTGVGESFLRSLACFRVALAVSSGATPQSACEEVVGLLGGQPGAHTAGLLALDREGRVGAAFRGAAWQVEGGDGPLEARRSG